jgi:hypothetical protein
MATMEQLNALIDRKAKGPDGPVVDTESIVKMLGLVAQSIRGIESGDDQRPALDAIAISIQANADSLAGALKEIPGAIAGIQIPAPIVNVEAPEVTIQAAGPGSMTVTVVKRDDNGFLKEMRLTPTEISPTTGDTFELE